MGSLANSEDPDEMQHDLAFHLGLHCLLRVPTSTGNHGKPGKSLKKFHAWKNHGIGKKLNNHGKIMEFCEII